VHENFATEGYKIMQRRYSYSKSSRVASIILLIFPFFSVSFMSFFSTTCPITSTIDK
jgi:hypothetical protein